MPYLMRGRSSGISWCSFSDMFFHGHICINQTASLKSDKVANTLLLTLALNSEPAAA
jgi:hypothetical protein